MHCSPTPSWPLSKLLFIRHFLQTTFEPFSDLHATLKTLVSRMSPPHITKHADACILELPVIGIDFSSFTK